MYTTMGMQAEPLHHYSWSRD